MLLSIHQSLLLFSSTMCTAADSVCEILLWKQDRRLPPPTFWGVPLSILLRAYRKTVAHSSLSAQSKSLDFLGQGPPAPGRQARALLFLQRRTLPGRTSTFAYSNFRFLRTPHTFLGIASAAHTHVSKYTIICTSAR